MRHLQNSTHKLTYLILFVPPGTQSLSYSFSSTTAMCFVLGFAPGDHICAKFSVQASSPSRGWTASSALPLGVPVECLSYDAGWVPSQGVPIPSPFPLLDGLRNCCVLLQSSSLEIVSGHLIRRICRRQVFTKTWGFESSALVCFHVSEPYNKTDFTLELKMVSLVLFQAGFRVTKTCRAFPILDLMSSQCSAPCLTDNASQVSEALNIFCLCFMYYVLFCDLDECVGRCVDPHALCFLGVYLQSCLQCNCDHALGLLLYVIEVVGQQSSSVLAKVHCKPLGGVQYGFAGSQSCPVMFKRTSLSPRISTLYLPISLATWAALPVSYIVRTFHVAIRIAVSGERSFVCNILYVICSPTGRFRKSVRCVVVVVKVSVA